jgi:hypothetical protein
MAFSVIATLLIVHGLATPGVILPDNGVVQVAGALNPPICGAILAASGLRILRRPRRVKLLLAIQLCVVAALAVAGAAALVFSPDIAVVPDPSTVAAKLIVVVGAIPLGLLAWRAGRTYLLTRRWPTSTTRSRRTACTARPGPPSARSRCWTRKPALPSTPIA